MSYGGSMPQGHHGSFPGQPQPQQPHPQQQLHHPQQQQQQQHSQQSSHQYAPQPGYYNTQHQQFMHQNQQLAYGYPSQQLPYDYSSNYAHLQQQQTQQPSQAQAQAQAQAQQQHMIHGGQEQWRLYNNGGFGADRGMHMSGSDQYMAPANVWQQQQQQQQQHMVPQTQQQHGYHTSSPQMPQMTHTTQGMMAQGQQLYHQQAQQQQQPQHQQAQHVRHLQQAPRRSPSLSQMSNQHVQQTHPSPSHHPQSLPQSMAPIQPQAPARASPVPQQFNSPAQQVISSPVQTVQQQQQQLWPSAQVEAQIQNHQQPYRSPSVHQHQQLPESTIPQKKKRPQITKQPVPIPSPQQQTPPLQPAASLPQPHIPPYSSPQSQPLPQLQPQPDNQVETDPEDQPEPQTAAADLPNQQHQESRPETVQFVNLQDIQRMPMSIQPEMGNLQSSASLSTTLSPSQPAPPMKKSPSTTPKISNIPPIKSERSKPHPSPKTSASQSPAPSIGRIPSKSPATSSKSSPFDTPTMMVSLAEELISKARLAAPAIAASSNSDEIEEYQRMMGTGMACLEGALQSQRLTPRQEARVRLRYAAVLQEETENIMEAETTLTKGITLCDKHRMLDLKYCVLYLMMKALFRRNRKAATKALDQHISDCEAFQHVHWAYVFRLLKASFYMEAGTSADAPSLENMRSIHNMAAARGDAAMCVYASLSEALILLQTSKGTPEMIQACQAQASKYQLDPRVQIPHLELLALLVDYLSSLNREKQDAVIERLRRLQKKIDECQDLANKSDFLLPIRKQASGNETISPDVSAIVRPGIDGDDSDYLVMSFVSQLELTVLVFTMGGLTYLHKPASPKTSSAELWRQGLKILGYWNNSSALPVGDQTLPLTTVVKQMEWRADVQCYLNLLLGLLAASQCKWEAVQFYLNAAENVRSPESLQGLLRTFYIYLRGVSCQGVGDLDQALVYYQNEVLSLHTTAAPTKQAQRHLALLAGMNRLWIMQHSSQQNDRVTMELLNELEPLCREHYNFEIRGAWSGVKATVVTKPPRQRNQRKEDAGRALGDVKASGNALATTVGLVIARDLLYNNVLGDQAWKCMQAAAHWANKSCNPLWQSVVDGILADFSEARNEKENAVGYWQRGIQNRNLAFARSS